MSIKGRGRGTVFKSTVTCLFLHGLEQAGLGSWHGAIDFIDEHDVGQNWAGAKLKVGALLIEELGSHHIGRQKIGRTLNSLESAVQGSRGRLGKKGFAHTGISSMSTWPSQRRVTKIRSMVLSLPIMTLETLARKLSAFCLILFAASVSVPFPDPLKWSPVSIRYLLPGRAVLVCLSFSQVILICSSVS